MNKDEFERLKIKLAEDNNELMSTLFHLVYDGDNHYHFSDKFSRDAIQELKGYLYSVDAAEWFEEVVCMK